MIREIINFTKDLPHDLLIQNLKPKEGVHIQVTLDKNGRLIKREYGSYIKSEELNKFLQNCRERENKSECVSMNKTFDIKKKIHSCSPFCIAFKIKTFNSHEVQERFDNYFDMALTYCDNEKHKKWAEIFRIFCKNELTKMLEKIIKEIEASRKSEKRFSLNNDHYIYIYLANVDLNDYEVTHQKYLEKKVFNKIDFNITFDNQVYGVSDYLTGYNEKKPFLKHKTATFEVNSKVSSEDALTLFCFHQLKKNSQLPNPLPIFIEKRELNKEVVKIFNRKGEGKIGYAQIIEEVYQKYQDLGNYYLLYIQGDAVKDFDFVSSFRFYIDPPLIVKSLFTSAGNLVNQEIRTVFEFERTIIHKIFNNQLVRIKDGNISLRYFDDIDYKPQYISPAEYRLVLKYRKAFYDYIYKSKREAIKPHIFFDIMQTIILDDLHKDEYKDKHHSHEFSIKEKMNIWFSLYEFFNNVIIKGDKDTMASKIVNLQQRMKEIANNSNAHVETDKEFAFAAGQVIYYLLDKSETSNKTHGMLEPFLQKTDCEQLKIIISKTIDRYKHAIGFYKGRFEKLASEVLSYETNVNLKTLIPLILAGYFSDSIIYSKKESVAV